VYRVVDKRGHFAAPSRPCSVVKRFVDGRPAVQQVALELREAMLDDA
jgi:hypothetical protein